MHYLKVFTDFVQVIDPLGDAEKGRLFVAMLKYAETGEEPRFSGSERFVWPTAKLNIDREVAFCAVQREKAKKRKSQTEPKPAKASQTEPKPAKASHKDKDKDKDNKLLTTLPSFIHSTGEDPEADAELERLIERLQLDLYGESERSFAKSVESAIRVMWYSNTIKVSGQRIGQGAVRSVLRELNINHVDFILSRLRNTIAEDPVVNGQAYLISCIYNAPMDCAVNTQREA